MNYEYLDRIIISAKDQIKDKKEVNVELVKILIGIIEDLRLENQNDY